MKFYKTPFTNIIFSDAITKLNSGIYLTIDDSPSPATPFLLDFLDKENIKATFFVIGKNIMKYPTYYEEIKKRGHTIGNHSYFHKSAFKVSKDFYMKDVKIAFELTNSLIFRPPYGHLTLPIYKKIKEKFNIILWTYMTYDFSDIPLKTDKIKNGNIIVVHDNNKNFQTTKKHISTISQIAKTNNWNLKQF